MKRLLFRPSVCMHVHLSATAQPLTQVWLQERRAEEQMTRHTSAASHISAVVRGSSAFLRMPNRTLLAPVRSSSLIGAFFGCHLCLEPACPSRRS